MTKKKIDKTPQKREAWIYRTALALGISEVDAEKLLVTPRRQSIRVNTLKSSADEVLPALQAAGWKGESYSWLPEGYTLAVPVEQIRDSRPVMDGQVFIQNAASWLPVLMLDAQPGEQVLDVCAAPGGKTSHIAAMSNNQARIWANDNSRPRLAKMQANLERLGAAIERFTLFDATALARKLEGEQFDKILLDAPCSGEGMMNLNNKKDLGTWSVAQIKRLQQEQKKILAQAWQLLKPGGTLVYSTCTMAPEEDEAVVDYLLRSQQDAAVVPIDLQLPNRVPAVQLWNGKEYVPEIQGCMRLIPSQNIEAFFVCKLQKLAVTE